MQATGQTYLIPRTDEPDRPSTERLAGSFIAGFSSVETRKAYAYDLRCWFEFLRRFNLDLFEIRRPAVRRRTPIRTYVRQ